MAQLRHIDLADLHRPDQLLYLEQNNRIPATGVLYGWLYLHNHFHAAGDMQLYHIILCGEYFGFRIYADGICVELQSIHILPVGVFR